MLNIRTFDTGATRDALGDKLQYEGYFSPVVLEARARYMRQHQTMADGSLREPDNWQKGIPKAALMDSGFRHFMDWWMVHRGHGSREGIEAALCGLMFNAEAYLHALLTEPAELPIAGNVEVAYDAFTPHTCSGSGVCGVCGRTLYGTTCQTYTHAIDADGAVMLPSLSVKGSDDPRPLPQFGPGSPAASGDRHYAGEAGDEDHAYLPAYHPV